MDVMWGVALACSGTHVTVGEFRVEIGEFRHAPQLVNVDIQTQGFPTKYSHVYPFEARLVKRAYTLSVRSLQYGTTICADTVTIFASS